MEKDYCLFCDRNNKKEHKIILENDFCYARWDNFPVSKGHLEVVPKLHISSFFDIGDEQLTQLFALIKKTKAMVQKKYNPDGYNIGINEGEAAGRTVHHLHIHLIPRYKGDIKNPNGGVRNIIPGMGKY
jgi:diadenosine tetraphosphate (Ap4A) HIT family hydrolase